MASLLVRLTIAALEALYAASFISISPGRSDLLVLTGFRLANESKVTPNIHNGAPNSRSPVMCGPDVLCAHIIQFLASAKPESTEIRLHDLVELRGLEMVRGFRRAVDTFDSNISLARMKA